MMIYSLVLSSLFSICFATCADNCARAVAATKNTGRYPDCPSFMVDTYTPATVTTITTTYTPTVYSIFGGGSKRKRVPTAARSDKAAIGLRQVTVDPATIPAYATSACTAPSMFSSACECLGYTASTTTEPAPWHTITATTTTTIPVCDPANNYGLQFAGGEGGGSQRGGANILEYYNVTPQNCCARCFQESEVCEIYAYDGSDCEIWQITGGDGGQAVPFCPWGSMTFYDATPTTALPTLTYQAWGTGPCGAVVTV